MAYSTGSGDYVALMAAVLAHAIGDGWTATSGNWPISKGNIRGVNWSTSTASITDYTSGTSLGRTERVVLLSIGSSTATATSNAASAATAVTIANMEFLFTEWHIFSDSGAGKPNYIHVAAKFSNGSNPNCWIHFSFGEMDKGGMSYHSCVFAASTARRAWVRILPSIGSETTQSYDFNCSTSSNWNGHFSGATNFPNYYRQGTTVLNLVLMVNGAASPFPGAGGWPASDTIFTNSSLLDIVWPEYQSVGDVGTALLSSTSYDSAMCSVASLVSFQPYSGGVSLQPPVAVVLNGNSISALGMIIGTFPGVRYCNITSFAEAEEITYSADTWKLMPLLRKTPWNQCQLRNIVSSGEAGIAYKKVV